MVAPSPIIVIGSGRSGTSLVSRLLQRLGIRMGRIQDRNGEALMFIRLNTWLMSKAGVTWHSPAALADRFDDPRFLDAAVARFERGTARPHTLSYLNPGEAMRYARLEDQPEQWGWKDPRNTFTLPAWLEVFPEAKVIHVKRHGIDVARSYWQVQQDRQVGPLFHLEALRRRRFHLPTVVRELQTWRRVAAGAGNLQRFKGVESPMDLWSSYTDQAVAHIDALGPERGLEMRFEDLVGSPIESIRDLAGFCGHEPNPGLVEDLAAGIDPGRSTPHRAVPELVELSERWADQLQRHGYSSGDGEQDRPSGPNDARLDGGSVVSRYG